MLKITGLNDFMKKLDDLEKRVQALDGEHHVPVKDLLTPAFVSRHTRFTDIDELFAASGFKVETQEDLAAIPDAEWDEFISSVSSFPDWGAMLGEATKEWAMKRLGI